MKSKNIKQVLLTLCCAVPLTPVCASAEALHRVDVLGVYPDHVVDHVADPVARFASQIEYANKALQNSGANYRYNLVHVQQQNWSNDNAIGSAQLKSLRNDQTIKQLREEYGADLVAAMVPTSNGYCGIGYLPSARKSTQEFYSWASSYAYSLSGHNCGGRTMAHEMGHNMGLGHSPAQNGSGTLATWGRGWGVNNAFVTIMAYSSAYKVRSSAGNLQIHSNPDLSVCNGLACGQDIDEQDGADATRALNLASPQIAQWLASVTTVPQNTAPVAVDDAASTDANQATTINVLNNDSDPDDDAITIASVDQPAHGQATILTQGTSIAYTPDENFDGNDSFTYTISDARGATNSAQVAIRVDAVVVPDPVTENDGNLVQNGDAELGLYHWQGVWGASIASSGDAHSGEKAVKGEGGRGIFVDLVTPIAGNKNLVVSGWMKASETNTAYIYTRIRQDGAWRYRYITSVRLEPEQWTNFSRNRFFPGSEISGAKLLAYFPRGIAGDVILDDLQVAID